MSVSVSRAQFLRGKFSNNPPPIRPPWALPEGDFIETCTACGDCAGKCPEKIIVSGVGRFPVIDFSNGECSFCGACVEACSKDALKESESLESLPWLHTANIGEGCLARKAIICRSCGDNCEPEAIRFSMEPGGISKPVLDKEKCTGCGACYRPCPANAITMEAV